MADSLIDLLSDSTDPDAAAWLQETISGLREDFQKRPFYYAFSGVSRHFDKSARVSAEAESGFEGWDAYRVARVALLDVLAEQDRETFLDTFLAILNTADIREQVALFSALPRLPHQEDLVESATDGLRSNIIDIFDSIALQNSFPRQHFTDEAWNQMVLKAIFISRPLYRIDGIADRRNAPLAEAISDLAHERWAAGRLITPEAWRSRIGFLDDRIADDIRKIAESENSEERDAAALVISEEPSDTLSDLEDSLSAELSRVESGELTWQSLGREMEEKLTRKSLT